jgi:cytoskeleton protein RodZ
MIDEPRNAPADERDEPMAGKRLAQARRMREISVQDIAKELHLDEPKVRALEQNRFDFLGAPVFVKGYLRKYAEVVGVSAEDVLADYHRFDRGVEPPIVGLRRHSPREISAGPWLAAFLAIAVVSGGAWVWLSGNFDFIFSSRAPAVLAPFEAEEPAPDPDAAEATGGETPDIEPQESPPVTSEPPPALPAETNESPATLDAPESAPPAEGEVGLRVTFSGECWTEVTDASGERLYFGLGRAGQTVSVVGAAPLQVLLGDSRNASLAVDGRSYPIPPSARRGDTARLTITAR